MFNDGKIELDKYIHMSATQFPLGHSTRKRDAEEAFRDVRTSNVHSRVLKELEGLKGAGAYKEPRSYPVVDDYVAEFAGTPKWRRPILLIVGGTNLGKSMLGGSVLQKVAGSLGLQSKGFLEVTVEGDGHLVGRAERDRPKGHETTPVERLLVITPAPLKWKSM